MGPGERGGGTVERICLRRGEADARTILFPRNWLRTGISRGKGARGIGLPLVVADGGGPGLVGRAPCSIAAASYDGGGPLGSSAIADSSLVRLWTCLKNSNLEYQNESSPEC